MGHWLLPRVATASISIPKAPFQALSKRTASYLCLTVEPAFLVLSVGGAQALRQLGRVLGFPRHPRAWLAPFSKTVKPSAPFQVGTKANVTKSDSFPKMGCK